MTQKNKKIHNIISDKHYKGMIESTPAIPWTVDLSTFKFTYVGPQAENILGYPVPDWYEEDFWGNHMHPDDRKEALEFCEASSKKGNDYNFAYRMIHKNGNVVHILDYVNIINEKGRPTHLQGFMLDVTSVNETARSLHKKNAELNAIYSACPDMIFIHDNQGNILNANEAAINKYQCSIEQFQKLNFTDLFSNSITHEKIQYHFQKALQGDTPSFSSSANDNQQSPFPIEVQLRLLDISDDANDTLRPSVISIIRDITNQQAIEQAITNISIGVSKKTGDEFYNQLVQSIAALFNADYAFIGLLDTTNSLSVNSISAWGNGAPADDFSYPLKNTPCANVVNRQTCIHISDVQTKFPLDELLINMAVNNYIGIPLFNLKNNPIGLIVIVSKKKMQNTAKANEILAIFAARASTEIERIKAETKLLQHQNNLEKIISQRTAELTAINKELESFSYSVSHDLRAPLRSIAGFSQILTEDYSDILDEDAQNYLGRIRAGAYDMGNLIDSLLLLSRMSKKQITRDKICITDISNKIINDIQSHHPERITHIHIQDNMYAVADQYLVFSVLENLINNAWKYSGKKPETHIEIGVTSKIFNSEDEIKPTGQVFFIKDKGAGFNMDYKNKLFAAFQRLHSKNDFEGSGIGLTTVQRIIHRHGGIIWADSLLHESATFYFTLGEA